MSERKSITEKDKIHEGWYKEARDITPETLPEFMRKLTEDYDHDYGTICHAASAAAVAAAWAIDKSPQGGITGFQSGCIMWGFIQHWMSKTEQPLALLDYENALYPQYEDKFNSISKGTWEWMQKEAQKRLDEKQSEGMEIHPEVKAHWISIAKDKIVPFGLKLQGEN